MYCGHTSVQWKLCKPTEDTEYCSLQLKPVFTSSLLSHLCQLRMVGEDACTCACRHRTIALSFHSKDRTTHQFSHYSCFQGVAHGSSGGNIFREMSGYLKAFLAAAHVLMVNGVSMAVVMAGTLQPGSENNCLKFIWATCSNLKLTFSHLKG